MTPETENQIRNSKFQRWFSRSEWLIRLLRLTKTQETTWEPGLVLIQIDGLARHQRERAMEKGHLPFLARLLQEHSYDLHSLYSGLPSSTPAMTAELLYGVKCAVPSFCFYSRPTRPYVGEHPPGARSGRVHSEPLPIVYTKIEDFLGGSIAGEHAAGASGAEPLAQRSGASAPPRLSTPVYTSAGVQSPNAWWGRSPL